MAGDWLKFETATLDKPEVWAIAQDLNIDPDAVIGKLLRVWSWFDQQSTIGNAPSVTKALLDRCAGVTGFCDSVIKAGWMVDDGEFISLPNFERHNGTTAKTRAQTGKRVKNHRSKDDEPCNAPSVTKALPEKRREENIKPSLSVIISSDTIIPADTITQAAEQAATSERFAAECCIGFIAHNDGRSFTPNQLVSQFTKWVDREWRFKANTS